MLGGAAKRPRATRSAGLLLSDPIWWRPRADPGQKRDTGGRTKLK